MRVIHLDSHEVEVFAIVLGLVKLYPPSALEGFMGLEAFSPHSHSGCLYREKDIANGSLNGDLQTHETCRGIGRV